MNARAYWQKLNAIGWLDYLPKDLQADARETLERNLSSEDTWCAHVALAQAAFEWSDGAEDILEGLVKCSRGLFSPTKIVAKSTSLSFTHGGKKYSGTVPDTGEWPGADVIELANQALSDAKAPQRFIELPDTPDFNCVVLVPPEVYAKAQKEGLIPSKYRVDACLVDRAEAQKIAGLKKIPERLDPVGVWDMTTEQLVALLQMMSGAAKVKMHLVANEPSIRKIVYELPEDVIAGIAKLPKKSFMDIAKKWRDLADLDKSYFDGSFLDLFSDKIYMVWELAQDAQGKTIQIHLRGV